MGESEQKERRVPEEGSDLESAIEDFFDRGFSSEFYQMMEMQI